MNDANRDIDALDAIAATYDPSDATASFDYQFKRLQATALEGWIRGGRVLELGCATGELAALIAPAVDEYHVVEGSQLNIDAARDRVPEAHFVHALWDDFNTDTRYSDVLLVNALEHAPDPVALLRRAATWLEPGGRVHAMVPNGLSLHRLIGVELGWLQDPIAVSDGDREQGHLRNYSVDTLLADVRRAGLLVGHWEGIFLKLLSNAQMLDWSPELVAAVASVSGRFPEHCAVLYAVGELPA